MVKQKLAQGVKGLRKRKGLSQEDLAKISGLSLRTIQRVENGETEPTGETLKRISAVLDVTLNELIDWDINKETLKRTVKIKNEYLHIFSNKLIISTTPGVDNLVDDYNKSVNNVFKTLIVFTVFIPIFAILTIIFYNMDRNGLALYAGAFAIFYFVMFLYAIIFTSGNPMIIRDSIVRIKFKKMFFSYNFIQIKYKDLKRIKTRSLFVKNNQINNVLDILIDEGLIKKNDVNLNYGKIKTYSYIVTFILIFPLIYFLSNSFFDFLPKADRTSAGYGVFLLTLSAVLILYMVQHTIAWFFKKKHKST